MLTLEDFLYDAWCRSAGIANYSAPKTDLPLDSIRDHLHQKAKPFVRLCENRMIVGSYRYGLVGTENSISVTNTNIRRMRQYISNYAKTQNKEALVDLANLCLIEFVQGSGHFEVEEKLPCQRPKDIE